MRRSEVAVHALLHVAALLSADDQNFFAVEASHSANDGGIVTEGAIAMNFAEVGEQAIDVVKSLRTLGCRANSVFCQAVWEAFISCRKVWTRS